MNINNVKNLFNSGDLQGESLVKPLKNFHGYFVEKKSKSTPFASLIISIMQIAAGILAYPALGALAAVGMVKKWNGVEVLKASNERQKLTSKGIQELNEHVRNQRSGGLFDPFINLNRNSEKTPADAKVVKIYEDDKRPAEDVIKEINGIIDQCTAEYKKVHVNAYYNRPTFIGASSYITAKIRVNNN